MTQVTGTFKVLGWEERSYDAEDLPQLTHAAVSQELQGGIEGEASIQYLLAAHEDRTATFIGLARVVGRIGEREGTFVMQDVGTFRNGVAKGKWTILSGTSTGDLEGIRGEGFFDTSHENATYTLEVSF
jgi:uncharacterized protein DUF3224